MRKKNEEFYEKILEEIKNNPKITEVELADKFLVSERTMRRYFKDLKDMKKITLKNTGKLREWQIL